MSRPRWSQIQQFCRKQGYREDRTSHWQYEKLIIPGFLSWTQVSFSKPDEQIGANLWKRVWHDQLQLAAEDDFWAGLVGQEVRYNLPPVPPALEPLPHYLEIFLRDIEHLTPEEITAVSLDEAKSRWLAYHSRELLDPMGLPE
jgi:hypothetical protein